ncbi:MAG TPA: poly(3-hydroxyalkanoate) depolymerase [Ktedonobacteraceae bacterium]
MDEQAEASLKAHMRTITVEGQRLRIAIRAGDGTRTPLLLMAGIGSSLEMLQPFVDEVDPAIEVICFDVPGTGGSPTPNYPYCLPALASLVVRMLDQLGYRQVDVLGFSWGGGLAQQFALQYSKRCRRLILVSTGTGATMIPGLPSALAQLLMPGSAGEPFYMKELASTTFGASLRSNPETMREFTHAIYPGDPLGYFYQLWAAMSWTSVSWLWSLRQPTLILAGDDDPAVPLINARILQYLIPRAKLYVYKGAHLGLVANAQELAGVIEQFLANDA